MYKICIDGLWFEAIKSKKTNSMIENLLASESKGLSNCYANPSKIKQDIYDTLFMWFINNDCVKHFTISSFNAQHFTIQALYIEPNTREILGVFVITKAHNKLYLL